MQCPIEITPGGMWAYCLCVFSFALFQVKLNEMRRCGCGATPDPSESPDAGNYVENGVAKYICLRCWRIENEGEGARPS